MRINPKSRRARNRLREHTLAVMREGVYGNEKAIYVICIDPDCPNRGKDKVPWSGWFTLGTEVDTTCDHDTRCCMPHDFHLEPHRLCPL